MHPLDRRAFLRNLGLATAAAWGGPELLGRYGQAIARTLGTAASVAGTTLEATVIPSGAAGYHKLIDGPGWPFTVRTLGPAAQSGREARRTALAAVVHLTDIHIIDAQSPARVEFLDRYADPPTSSIPFNAAQRPQETLTAQVSEAMVRRVNSLPGGPVTGRSFDCAVTTGDNIDNQQKNEALWNIGLLDGGPVTPNSGDPTKYEGVQDEDAVAFDKHYWHPENASPTSDFYKQFHGYPAYPGLLAAAIKGFTAEGLNIPWYTCYGNHDGLLQGNAPGNPVFEAIAVGPVKVVDLPAGMSPGDFQTGLSTQDPTVLAALATAPARPVTADPGRAIISAQDWVAAHLASSPVPGPVGHGFTAENQATGRLYYAFTIASGVVGISLDTVNRGGYAEGSIGTVQLDWLKARLDDAKKAGNLVVLFSHHNLLTLTNPVPDPPSAVGADPQRVQGAAIEAVLHQFANVVLWVNGHSHVNRITPHPDPSGSTPGFWEVSTAAHVDYPQHARLIELVDNRDGTLSIFGTLLEHMGPAAAVVGATDVLGLAAISRELGANDFQWDAAAALGGAGDRNVELVMAHPFSGSGSAGGSSTSGGADADGAGRGGLPATGWDSTGPLAVGAALVGGALALRRRVPPPRVSTGTVPVETRGMGGVDRSGDEA
ncbi:MAG TPA: TIGR03767 family metallophosphoesterase [Acidimicrobiales bacterium]|jgi:metallophosphoesterase (TIGR03767 family)|nr:TIGR03767 family metallophosphoesterase [Acidimicrobiales bacterium]